MNRRSVLSGGLLAATAGLLVHQSLPYRIPVRKQRRSRVAILRCDRYEVVADVVMDGLRILARPCMVSVF